MDFTDFNAMQWWRLGTAWLWLIVWGGLAWWFPGEDAIGAHTHRWYYGLLYWSAVLVLTAISICVTIALAEGAWYVWGAAIVPDRCEGQHVAFAATRHCGQWPSHWVGRLHHLVGGR